MRNIVYLSPTSISLFYSNLTEFYLCYLAEERPPRIPQTRPMSIGSSFDAYCKSHLHERLFGRGCDPRFEFDAILRAQVEPQNRDWAVGAGRHAFETYRESGALADLMLELSGAVGTPRFELEVRGVVGGTREPTERDVGPMTLLGKPDVWYVTGHGANVILDWKVNGYCSQWGASPMQGYVRLRERSASGWTNRGRHKDAMVMNHHGMMINASAYLEHFDRDWARQLAIYSWLSGMDVGGDFIVAVDQLACKAAGEGPPAIRVAEHRLRVSHEHQWRVLAEAQHAWEVVHSNHIFRDLSPEDSVARCLMLEGTARALKGAGTDEDRWFSNACRSE